MMIDSLIDEQPLAQIKHRWQQYKHYILTVVAVLVLGYGGWELYHRRQSNIANHASMLYDQVLQGVVENDETSIQAGSNRLLQDFSNTLYAHLARLILAKSAIKQQAWDKAIEYLQVVAKQAKDEHIQDIARLRLAKLYIQKNDLTEALKWLEAIKDDHYVQAKSLLQAQLYYQSKRYEEAQQTLDQALRAGGHLTALIQMVMADWDMLALKNALDRPPTV